MPPGLHRKSLEVITPGRKVKFTASTGQRHETWFNALSYLLMRGQDGPSTGAYSTNNGATAMDGGLTAEDVNEFNPGYGRNPNATNSRLSMSSYNSRTTRGTSGQRGDSAMSMRQAMPSNVVSTAAPQASTASRSTARHRPEEQTLQGQERDRTARSGSISSRFSKMLGSMARGSQTNRNSEPGMAGTTGTGHNVGRTGSIYDASIVSDGRNDSAEELRKELLKQEKEADRLENVRACCDGKIQRDEQYS